MGSGRVELDEDIAARGEQRPAPGQQPDRVTADTDIAVGEKYVPPAPLAGQR
jgi:hypothetical protein